MPMWVPLGQREFDGGVLVLWGPGRVTFACGVSGPRLLVVREAWRMCTPCPASFLRKRSRGKTNGARRASE